MSSGYPAGAPPDFFSSGTRSAAMPNNINSGYNVNLNPQQQFSFRSPLAEVLPASAAQIRRPEFMGKRSLAEFQQNQLALAYYLRNVKMRPIYQHRSPISPLSPMDLSPTASFSPEISILRPEKPQHLTLSNGNANTAYDGIPFPGKGFGDARARISGPELEFSGRELAEKSMMNHRLQELEKQLLGDDDDDDVVSVVTNSEWSEAIRDLISPTQKLISLSPTSSSSSCCSTSASPPLPCPKQALIDAAVAISEGKLDTAAEILTRIQQTANASGNSKQRLAAYMVSALRSRVSSPAASEVSMEEHAVSTQMLYCVCPCFKLSFMAANLTILETTAEREIEKIHVLDFGLDPGGQYVHLLHALAAKTKHDRNPAVALTITTFSDGDVGEEKLKTVGEGLKALAQKICVSLSYHVKDLNIHSLSRENLEIQSDEALAVNFAFKLQKLPDESVTIENLRDDLLRRVRDLSPTVVTVVEQEMNTNTAPLATRVRDTYEYYGALLDSLDSTVPATATAGDNSERVRIEDGLGRKMGNSVACEGRDRVERCEVFGKWRARMSMAGFQPRAMTTRAVEFLRSKLDSGTCVNSGFTVNEEFGGICFGWKGKTLTVASAWR